MEISFSWNRTLRKEGPDCTQKRRFRIKAQQTEDTTVPNFAHDYRLRWLSCQSANRFVVKAR